MDTKELRKKSKNELEKMLDEKAVSLNKFKFGMSQSKLKNVKEGKNLRKEIAQILTVLSETKKTK